MKSIYKVLYLMFFLIQGCVFEEKLETLNDVFLKIQIGRDVTNIPVGFIRKPDGNLEAYINDFNVVLLIANNKVKSIIAKKEFGNRGEHITTEFKNLRASIFYEPINSGDANIFKGRDEAGMSKVWTTETWNRPKEYCRYQIYGESEIWLEFKNGDNMKMIGFSGKDSPNCDNRRRASKDWQMHPVNGSIKIEKGKYGWK